MINNLLSLLTYENIYLIANYGVIPFWLLLIFFPNHQINKFFYSINNCSIFISYRLCLFILYNLSRGKYF